MSVEEEYREHRAMVDRLVAKYPKLLRKTLREQHMYSVDKGWYAIYDELCAKVDALLTEKERKHFHFVQFKEKLGGMRVYWDTKATRTETIAMINTLVEAAEKKAGRICQVCGEPGRLDRTRGGWWITGCPEHFKEQQDYEVEMGETR
jgi:hypothetical protein